MVEEDRGLLSNAPLDRKHDNNRTIELMSNLQLAIASSMTNYLNMLKMLTLKILKLRKP